MLQPTTPDGSTYRLFYDGPVGVVGVGVTQTLDLTALPDAVREDPSFEDNWLVLVDPGAGVSEISTEVTFNDDAEGLPAEMVLTLTSTNVANGLSLQAWYIHSVTR